jgi:hypothetical protein
MHNFELLCTASAVYTPPSTPGRSAKHAESLVQAGDIPLSQPGKYKIRVAITDSLGHVAVSGWKTVTVR